MIDPHSAQATLHEFEWILKERQMNLAYHHVGQQKFWLLKNAKIKGVQQGLQQFLAYVTINNYGY